MDYCTPTQHEVYKKQIADLEEKLKLKDRQIELSGGDCVCKQCETFQRTDIDCEIYKYAKMARGVKPEEFGCWFFEKADSSPQGQS